MELLLTRHGQTTSNVEGRIQGHAHSDLTPLGIRQAERLASRVRDERIDAVYASDLQRTMDTAAIVLGDRQLPVRPDPAWREISFGAWEGLLSEEVPLRYPEEYARREADKARIAPPGGESLAQVQERVAAAVTRLRAEHAGETVLVVTHGGVLRLLACWLLGLPLNGYWPLAAGNCGLSRVTWKKDKPVIETWNEVDYERGLAADHVGADAALAGAHA